MAKVNFRVEQGLEIDGVYVITGTGAPAGTTGETDDAPVGSLYLREDGEGQLYRKSASTSSASDWEVMADGSVYTALGISDDDEDMGAYTGDILTDNATQTTLNQELSDAIEAVAGGTSSTDNISAATPTTVSTCLVDDCNGVEWEVTAFEQGAEATKEFFKLTSLHNGTSSADAATVDWSTHSKLKTGTIAGLTFQPVLSGTGAAQTIGLEISATAAITVEVRRTAIP